MLKINNSWKILVFSLVLCFAVTFSALNQNVLCTLAVQDEEPPGGGGGGGGSGTNPQVYVKVKLVKIYYEDDYDGLLKGKGEMWVTWNFGDESNPGSRVVLDSRSAFKKIRSIPDVDSKQTYYWNLILGTARLASDSWLYIRIQAQESDGILGNDAYPKMEKVFATWENLDQGWKGPYKCPNQDCTYYYSFIVSSNPI